MKLTITKQFQNFISSQGLSLEHLLQQANIPNLLWREELVVNEQQYYDLLQVFNQYVSDQQILAFSEIENINMFMPPIYAALSAENGMEALKRFISYKKLIGPITIGMEVEGKTVQIWFSFVFPNQELPRFALLNEQLLLLSLLRRGSKKEVTPLLIEGPFEYGESIKQYLNCNPRKSRENLLVLKLEDLKYPFYTQNNIMWEFIEPELKNRLVAASTPKTFVETIQKVLFQVIPSGNFSLQDVALKIGISTRTLQRNLQAENTTFNRQLQEAQKVLSLNFLQNNNLRTAEIAYLVGFSEVSSFSRAFKKWTGKNISQYKQDLEKNY
ncbi:helix-turn-helix domain-containing protein [Enterococcus sp. 5H]|uniref:helix-turn-helix domain-containing protein n=1 Tax=Enterococcus sp. 5H TaxID=1229490 RepID=UPI002302D6B5|nr:AraC family transcriptional regulator [Enterococcus sp. 5H]MDA9472190.1 Transcriptional regulator, AraC family [Enterococcus sp. 5H]